MHLWLRQAWWMAIVGVSLSLVSPEPPAAQGFCTSDETPIGALPPAVPVWCVGAGADGPSAERVSDNAWIDDFDHGLSHAPIGRGYREFAVNGTRRAQTFRHANHWMQDVATDAVGGVMMRPDQAFRFEQNRLVVEFDLAAGLDAYDPAAAWGEIDITTAPAPNRVPRRDALYGYDQFPGHFSLGCRLQPDRVVTCSLFDDSTRGVGEGGRLWEMSFFQHAGTTSYGGGPFGTLGAAFRRCRDSDPDLECRDRFRLELTDTRLTLFANDVKYFEQAGLPPLPTSFLHQDVYVYFAGMQARVLGDRTTRFHWDRIAVNPHLLSDAPPSSAPTPPRGVADR